MGAPTSTGGVVETIRRQLAAGYSGDDIVDGLIAGGLSRPSAERFVQRAGGQITTAAPPPIPSSIVLPPPVPMTSPVPQAPSVPVLPGTRDAPAATMDDAPPPLPSSTSAAVHVPPPVPAAYGSHAEAPQHVAPPMASDRPARTVNGLKLAGGAALLIVGLGLLVVSFSADGRVRLKLPLALVLGGGVTLVQAIRER
jgi:hypothetical protein